MGRKSVKAKEKKLKRKEESARLAISVAKVDAANKLEDPLSLLEPFKKFNRNGVNLTIECCQATDLDKDTKDFVFDLCKTNMQALYEASSWGWKDRDKREEMYEDRAWYLIARNEERLPVAFVHFRFDIELDEEVLYCYEIQLTPPVRRKGLGKFLMQILELMAYKTEMVKVMLTTFKHNDDGLKFFQEALKYQIDESSPDDGMYEEECHYWILSKPIKQKAAVKPTNQGAANGVDSKTTYTHTHTHSGCC
ncbi:N-alpha-acetyltransferase 40-like [Dreissena polymorpha]|uniref:N-alpha-acetyltransferase 40-like n=1 Tax=Dreissena polymorpha TaxID=45954 RepID=UPI0022648DAA|nr:N-alpha-acetyltransferase 40-like [Dreissena polymorpha]